MAPVDIRGLGTATPEHRLDADDLAAILPRVWPALARRVPALLQQSGGQRFVVRPPSELLTQLRPADQTARYLAAATDLALTAARAALADAAVENDDVGLLVVASCTGFVLPGVDARLVAPLGLRRDVVRMPFMQFGCAGGAAALGHAAEWARAHPGRACLVVAVELPSVTFRPADTSVDNLLSTLVFGDGAGAAVLHAAGDEGAGPLAPSIGRVRSVLVPDSTGALGYEMDDDGYRVVLSRGLPDMLERELPTVVGDFLGDGARAGALDVVAIHPGGPAILGAVQRSLRIPAAAAAASWSVLQRVGNTSSAGVLFVLEELLRGRPVGGRSGLLLAFGPGVTVEMLELRAC